MTIPERKSWQEIRIKANENLDFKISNVQSSSLKNFFW